MSAPNNPGFADDIRDAMQALMEADPYYADVPILTQRLQDLEAKVDEIIGITGGILILLVVPTLGQVVKNVPGANFGDVKLVARAIENVTINETGKSAQAVAIYTAALWSQLRSDALDAPLILEDVLLGNDPRGVTFDAIASTHGGTQLTIPRLASLTIDASDLDAITLTAATSGAVIFLTADGTPPIPRNPAAMIINAPFSSEAGDTIRARAYLPGFIPSPELRVTL